PAFLARHRAIEVGRYARTRTRLHDPVGVAREDDGAVSAEERERARLAHVRGAELAEKVRPKQVPRASKYGHDFSAAVHYRRREHDERLFRVSAEEGLRDVGLALAHPLPEEIAIAHVGSFEPGVAEVDERPSRAGEDQQIVESQQQSRARFEVLSQLRGTVGN